MLAIGDRAPAFEAISTSGGKIRLDSFRGRTLVLYFFPKAGTMGCTRESMDFARHYAKLREAGMEVIGVSVDAMSDQQKFAEECKLPFPLIADSDKRIARDYGVLGAFGYARRVTFFLDAQGLVTDVVQGMFPGPHVARAIARAQKTG